MINFVEELTWRGLFYDIIPGTEEFLNTGKARGYIGFDPSAPSLQIGNLVQIIILMHFQRAGHQPIALVGGATGMIGDPSGKSEERTLLSEEQLQINQDNVRSQLEKFLDFEDQHNPAIMVNNYDWYKDMNVLEFLRNVGKHLSINYMMAKDSVKSRLETGISYTEFTYQLLQGYDFYMLYKHHNCRIQMGGSDQWGNLTAGVELIRRKDGGEAFAITSPLVTKADGTKFGKTEKGTIYLSPNLTSPYQFYQFWLNVSDEEAKKFVKIFTFLSKEEIVKLIEQHDEAPHQRELQKALAREVTVMVHSDEDYENAVQATEILFGKGTKETLSQLPEQTFLQVFEGVPQFNVSRSELEHGSPVLQLLADTSGMFPSRGEVRRTIQQGGLSINKEKVEGEEALISSQHLLNNKYLLVQKGKKNYYLLVVS